MSEAGVAGVGGAPGGKTATSALSQSMAQTAANAAAVKAFATMLSDFERRLIAIERTPSLANSAIMNGALRAYTGTTQTMIIGLQWDGTNAAVPVSSPPPPTPYRPTVVGRPGGIVVGWDGKFAHPITGLVAPLTVAPMDFAGVDVVVTQDVTPDWIATRPSHRFPSARGGEVFIAVESGTWKVALVARGQAGNASTASVPVEGIAPSIIDPSDGIEPQSAPTIEAIGGLGAVLVRVTTPVPNDDLVMYEYHVSPVPFSAIPNDDGTIAHRGPETSVTIRKYPNGDPIGPTGVGEEPEPVYVRVIPYDPDGFGPQSQQRDAYPIQVTSADIAAGQGWFGYLQATDFRSGTVSGDVLLGGRFATLNAGENIGQGFEVAAAGARWFNELGKVVVDIPSNLSSDNPATFSGKGIFAQLEATSGMTMRGTSRVAQGAELLLVNKQGPPIIAPVVGTDLETAATLNLSAAMSAVNGGVAALGYPGMQWDSTASEWLLCAQTSGGNNHRVRILRFSAIGAYLGELANFSVGAGQTVQGWVMTTARHFFSVSYGSTAGTFLRIEARPGHPLLSTDTTRKIGDAQTSYATIGADGSDLLACEIDRLGYPRISRLQVVTEGTNIHPSSGWQTADQYTVVSTEQDPIYGSPSVRIRAFAETNPVTDLLTWSNAFAIQPGRIYRYQSEPLVTYPTYDGTQVTMRIHFYNAGGTFISNSASAVTQMLTAPNGSVGHVESILSADVRAPAEAVTARVFYEAAYVDGSAQSIYFRNAKVAVAPGWNVTSVWTSGSKWANRERGATTDLGSSQYTAVASGVMRRTDADMGSVDRYVIGPSRYIPNATVWPFRTTNLGLSDGYQWPGPVGLATAFTYANGAYHVLAEGRIYKYGTAMWADDDESTPAAQWFAAYTWRDTDANGGTHESGLSPLTRFTMKKRHRAVITTGTVPSHSGTNDAVNAVGFYIGRAPNKLLVSNYATTAPWFIQTYQPHGLVVGDTVDVSSTDLNVYSGTFTVMSVVNSTQVTLNAQVPPGAGGSGGVTITKVNPIARTLMAYQSSLAVEPSLTVAATLAAPNPTTATSTNTITGLTHGPDPAGIYAFPNTSPGKIVSSARRASISNLPTFAVDGDGNGQWDDLMPPGAVIMFPGPVVPSARWKRCEGEWLSAALYPDVYIALGGAASPHGVDLVGGLFRLPDYRGRSPIGVGSADSGSGGNYYQLGMKWGHEQGHVHTHPGSGSGVTNTENQYHSHTTWGRGSTWMASNAWGSTDVYFPVSAYGGDNGGAGNYLIMGSNWTGTGTQSEFHTHNFGFSFTTGNNAGGNTIAGNVHPVAATYFIIKIV